MSGDGREKGFKKGTVLAPFGKTVAGTVSCSVFKYGTNNKIIPGESWRLKILMDEEGHKTLYSHL